MPVIEVIPVTESYGVSEIFILKLWSSLYSGLHVPLCVWGGGIIQ